MKINNKLTSYLNNKSILVTGATGSFGSKFVNTLLLKYNPKKIVIFSRDEYKQWKLKNNLLELNLSKKKYQKLRFFLGDVRDFDRLDYAFSEIDLVVHAAALKHVPFAEYNPTEYINTNINGAENVIKAAIKNNVKDIIALSTDKAANPSNLYGATKLVSDKLFVAANNIKGNKKIKFAVVRYGNVIGSRGSVIPLFKNLIKQKSKYIPITDERMTRFWISLDDGIDFVFKSILRMQGGEIFVPKIPSIKVVDIIKSIAPRMKLKKIGIRPGEKLYEILCPKDDYHHTINFKDHFVIFPTLDLTDGKKNFFINNLNEKGKKVKNNFEYNSENNPIFLKDKKLREVIDKIDDTI